MAQRPSFDLLVIGADAAGLAAGAAAARLGRRAAVVRAGVEPKAAGLKPSPPNFVWRLLDLHRYDLATTDAGLTLTHLAEGEGIGTLADPSKTARLLARRDPALEHYWPDFVAAMARAGSGGDGAAAGRDRRETPAGLGLSDPPWACAIDLLDDRFTDEGVKAHILMSALAPLGLAGDEPGSAQALFDVEAYDPPRRVDAEALTDALAAAAKDAGVVVEADKLVRLTREGERAITAHLEGGGALRAARIVASSALVAEAAGLIVEAGGSPLRRQAGAEATIRLRYARKPRVRAGAGGQLHHIVADKRSLQRARDAMLEGRIDDAMPLSFEIRGREIIARAPFAPAQIRDNGAMRDWTGQDLQILGRAAAAAIGRRLDPACGAPQSVEAKIGPDVAAGLRRRDFCAAAIAAPPPSIDAVGAAAALILGLAR
jgi:hypothetical protein